MFLIKKKYEFERSFLRTFYSMKWLERQEQSKCAQNNRVEITKQWHFMQMCHQRILFFPNSRERRREKKKWFVHFTCHMFVEMRQNEQNPLHVQYCFVLVFFLLLLFNCCGF